MMALEVSLRDMKWAELRAFVEHGAHLPDDDAVSLSYNEVGDPDGLRLVYQKVH